MLRNFPYTLVRSRKRLRTISLHIDPTHHNLRVMAPAKTPLRIIENLLSEKLPWIQRKLSMLREEKIVTDQQTNTILYMGHLCRIDVKCIPGEPQGCILLSHNIRINLPHHQDNTEARQEAMTELTLWLKRRARHVFERRIRYWENKTGLEKRKLALSNARGRWGSCSGKNNIRLNWRLVMAPLSVLDYVIVHELCHIQHKNHSPQFWQSVESFLPNYRQTESTLKRIGNNLMRY